MEEKRREEKRRGGLGMCNKGGREGCCGLGRKGLFGQVGVGGEKGGEGKGRERGV